MEQQDSLTSGVVVERFDDGDWWHGHIIRCDLEYHSALLGRPINLLFLMVKYGCGATRKSADFYLTLDAEGVAEELLPIRFTGDWGKWDDETELKMEALQIQNNPLPRLRESNQFQVAMATIVQN
jgi:hypothetical protein